MGKQILLVLGLIGTGHGMLLFFVARHVIRTALNGGDPTGLMVKTGGLIQFIALGIVLLVIVSGSISLAKTLKIHEM